MPTWAGFLSLLSREQYPEGSAKAWAGSGYAGSD